MEAHAKRLWIVTVANVSVVVLLLLVLYAIELLLAVLAPEISGWPLYILVPSGIVLSLVGLRFGQRVASRTSRLIAYVVNGGSLVFNISIVLGFVALFVSSTKEQFLIPEGYKGDVYVLYGAADGAPPSHTRWSVTYRIPQGGVLRVQGPMTRNWTRTEYDYELETGKVYRIPNSWPTTIHRTAENIANNKDLGVFFPRTGTTTDAEGCSVEYQLFYVGTKAHLLTEYKPLDLAAYLKEHPVGCFSQAK